MAFNGTGYATPEKRRDRKPVLSARSPHIEAVLNGMQIDHPDIEQARLFGNALLLSRDAWADRYRNGKRYSVRDDERPRNRLYRPKGDVR